MSLALSACSSSDSTINTGNAENGKNYYFDSDLGLDENTGDMESPWKSLSKLESLELKAGDRIRLHRGGVWREVLHIRQSGTPNNPIVVESYGEGALPVVSGGYVILQNSNWNGPDASGVYSIGLGFSETFYTNSAILVASESTAPGDYQSISRSNPQDITPNTFYIERVNTTRTLFYKPDTGKTPQQFQFEVSKRGRVVFIEGDFVEIRDINAILSNQGSNTYNDPETEAVIFSSGQSTVIDNCFAQWGRGSGIMVQGPQSTIRNSVAQYNESTGLYISTKAAVNSRVEFSTSRYNGNDLFNTDKDRGGIGIQAEGAVVLGNQVYYNGNPRDTVAARPGGDAAISIFDTANAEIRNNWISHSTRHAIQMSYGVDNYGHRIAYNVIYNWNTLAAESTLNTSAIYVQGYGNSENSGLFQVVNNTIYSDQTQTYLIGISLAISNDQDSIHSSQVVNNLIYFPNNNHPSSRGIRITRGNNLVNTTIDYNNVYMPQTQNHYDWVVSATGVVNLSSEFYQQFGYEQHGGNSLPYFFSNNPVNPQDFQLTGDSLDLINRGVQTQWQSDYFGQAIIDVPDIGAFEHVSN